jgi:hypothetical protein
MIALLFMLSFVCGDCPLTVQGQADVFAVVYYAHEDRNSHGYRYTASTPLKEVWNSTANLTCQGHEIGAEWWWIPPTLPLVPMSVKQCGDLEKVFAYPPFFEDGFETGDTSAWSNVVGGTGG